MIAPALRRRPMFAMSAKLRLELLLVLLPSGICHAAIAGIFAGVQQLVGQLVVVGEQPAVDVPSAITQAPVSVAMSTTAAGLKRSA